MFNEEDGRNVNYVKDMDMEEMGWTKNFYDKNSQDFISEYSHIEWPYTGFIQGVEGRPILIPDLAEWLKKSPYLERTSLLRKNFISYFEELI